MPRFRIVEIVDIHRTSLGLIVETVDTDTVAPECSVRHLIGGPNGKKSSPFTL